MAAYTTIDDPSVYFQTGLYVGTGSELVITNDGNSNLQPDLMWIKNRTDGSTNHHWHDTSRGTTVTLFGNKTDAEETQAQSVKSVQSDGFTLGTWDGNNIDDKNFVAWQWKATSGTTTTNTTGNGIDSVIQANAPAGFSIVTYTGNGTQSGQTVGHGLGAVPKMIISKDRNASSNVPHWRVYHEAVGNTKYLDLTATSAASDFNDWDDTTPTSTVYSVGGAGGYTPTNTNNTPYVAYLFADVQGYSKFGTYTGNGNASGPVVYTGFKPAFVLVKCIDAAGEWQIYDHKRPGYNFPNYNLSPNNATAEYQGASYHNMDILSNGFKILLTDVAVNTVAKKYMYAAFAENPFVTSTGIPTTAR